MKTYSLKNDDLLITYIITDKDVVMTKRLGMMKNEPEMIVDESQKTIYD
jgi:hypothetical protein